MSDYAYSPSPVMQFLEDDGTPLVYGYLCTYLAGTDTPEPTLNTDGKANEVQIKLDSRGETPTAILLDVSKAYKFRLLRNDKSLVWERDNIRAAGLVVGGNVVTGLTAESPVTLTYKADGATLVIGFDSTTIDESISAEAEARAEKDSELEKMLTAEAEARADADSALQKAIEEGQKAIAGKQDKLTAGDNIAISEASVISVTGRKRLKVKSPLTATADGESLTLGFAGGIYATADALAAEAEARDAADTTLQTNIDGKQDKLTFDEEPKSESANPVTSGGVYDALYELSSEIDTTLTKLLDGKQDALTFDEEPTSGSSNPVTSGGIYNAIQSEALARVTQTTTNAKNITAEADARKSADAALQAQIDAISATSTTETVTIGRITDEGLDGNVHSVTHGDWTFGFSHTSATAGTLTITNPNCSSADIFSESRTYGNTVRLAGQDLTGGLSVTPWGNGDANSYPARIEMDIYDATNGKWLNMKIMQYTSGTPLVIDYRITGG